MRVIKINAYMTQGVAELQLSSLTYDRLVSEAVLRWKKDAEDCFTRVEPDGINMRISNAMKLVATRFISDFPGLKVPVFIVVDDGSHQSEDGVIVTLLLPNEV